MRKTAVLLSLCGLILLIGSVSAVAQDTASGAIIQFKVPVAFYAGNAKMPAGSYKITQPATGQGSILKIQNAAGTHEAFLDTNPITAIGSHKAGDVVFDKVGNMEYLEEFYLPAGSVGFNNAVGFKIIEGGMQKKSESSGSKTQHAVAGSK